MKAKEIFNSSFAVYYERIINKISSSVQVNRWRNALVREALILKPNAKFVVDCCSGAGNVGKIYLKKNPNATVINCDISKPLLKLAKKRLKEKAYYIMADNRFFPLKENSVDTLFSSFCVRNSQDPLTTIKEAKRVLKPGGVWCILDFFKPEERSFYSLANNLIFRSFMNLNKLLAPCHSEAIDYLFSSIESFYSLREFKEILWNSGFEIMDVKNFMGGVASNVVAIKREVFNV